MTKDITATRKEFGNPNFKQIMIRVPDKVGEAFNEYNLQIIDYPNQDTVLFLCREGTDIDSVTFKAIGQNFPKAIKTLYERLIETK